jgi:hypothetical protein
MPATVARALGLGSESRNHERQGAALARDPLQSSSVTIQGCQVGVGGSWWRAGRHNRHETDIMLNILLWNQIVYEWVYF